ncbi:MAG: DMT family transporter [Pseudomonadota bacterium]
MVSQAAYRGSHLSYPLGVVLCALAGVCWSLIPLGIRHIESASVWQILFLRSAGLLPMLSCLMYWRSGGRPLQAIRNAGVAGVLGGMALTMAYAAGIAAVQLTSVANAAFLFATAPFMVALVSLVVLGERVRGATWTAMVVGLVGIGFMVSDSLTTGNWWGDGVALMAALGFALFTIALRWGKASDMMPVSFLGGLFALVLSGLVVSGTGQGLDLPMHEMAIAVMLGVVLLGLGMTLYTFGSQVVPGAELALLSMTEVVLAPVWVWLVLGETATSASLTGGGILMLAIVFNALTGLRRKPLPTGH